MSARPVARRPAALVVATSMAITGLGIGVAGNASAQTYWVPINGSLTVKGHGYGHGRGMSQYGAQGAALRGKSYQDIIGFYYPKTSWGKAKGPIRVLITADTSSDVKVSPVRGLSVRDLATSRVYPLPAKPATDRWRIVPGAQSRSVVQLHRKAGWKRWRVLKGDGEFFANAPLTVWLPSGSGQVAHKYRGRIRAASPYAGAASRDTVNVLRMDAYVRGVVPLEMPSSWAAQALRAQAVAARTYATWSRAQNRGRYYQICDTTSCQVYGGLSAEAASSNAAVKATSRRIVLYRGKAAFTQFSSSNGGWTSDGGVPYLPAKKDPYDGWSGNSVHDWSATINTARLNSMYPQLGGVKSIRATRRTGDGAWGGRVVQLVLVGRKSKVFMSGDDFRYAFGLRSTWFSIAPTPIIARWDRIGGRQSKLGKVTTNEFSVPNGSAQGFQNGRIYWSQRTQARELYGRILQRYRKLGGPTSSLRYPVTGMLWGVKDGRRAEFQRGKMYWHQHTGAHRLAGRILARYKRLGEASSKLGYPTSGVFKVGAGKRARFQGGALTYKRSRGYVKVHYR